LKTGTVLGPFSAAIVEAWLSLCYVRMASKSSLIIVSLVELIP